MSLINDMLQDLDRSDARDTRVLPAGLASGKPPSAASSRRYLLPGLAAVAVVYAVIVEWNLLGLMPAKTAPAMDIPQPISINSKWLKLTAAPNAAIENEEPVTQLKPAAQLKPVAQLNGATVAVDVSADDRSQPAPAVEESPAAMSVPAISIATASVPTTSISASAVEPLVAAGERALAANRLTTPVGDNAYELFKSALLLDPHNAAAQAGVETIRQRYLTWLEHALASGRTGAAQAYLQKARNVGVEPAVLATYEPRLPQAPQQEASEPVVDVRPKAVITPAKMADDATVADRLRTVGLRAETEALGLIREARAVPQTAVALADLYVERQARNEMFHLAELLTNKTESAYAYVAAQLWLFDGQERRSIDALSTVEFSGLAERQRQRLLAGLRQRAGDYGQAMELYSQLVAASPDSVADWLGLAVSADRSNLLNTALDAYEKVLLLRHPDSRVMQFARQRQQDLSLAVITNR
jgi:tetratricopeptide (TPR) repeat protein